MSCVIILKPFHVIIKSVELYRKYLGKTFGTLCNQDIYRAGMVGNDDNEASAGTDSSQSIEKNDIKRIVFFVCFYRSIYQILQVVVIHFLTYMS